MRFILSLLLALSCVFFFLSAPSLAYRSKSGKFYSIKEPHIHTTEYEHSKPRALKPVRSPAFNLEHSIKQVASFADDAQKIIDIFTNGELKHVTLSRLANFTDYVGNRVCGSKQLENAVDYLVSALKDDTGLQNVNAELVSIPYWTRGQESAVLLSARQNPYPFSILGLGGSVGTQAYGDNGLTADAIVVRSFAELKNRASEAKGKIVIYNQYCDWDAEPVGCYGTSVQYRGSGASQAAQYGAVAALVRTVGGFSINSPHTGSGGRASIPVASITIEDAEMFQRLADRGEKLTIQLKMQATNNGNAPGHNVVAEIVGSTYPEEVVLVSGHLDSWDVGQGAMDDGGGMAISWSVLTALARTGLRPKRTIRFVAWSCEELGGVGADQYYEAHKDEVPTMSLVMESDLGVFHPLGIEFTGNAAATQVMQAIGQLLAPINATQVTGGGEGTDIDAWMQAGVPGASLANENERYFWFHHSYGDTITVLDYDDVDLCAATWAVTAYAVANLDSLLPRN